MAGLLANVDDDIAEWDDEALSGQLDVGGGVVVLLLVLRCGSEAAECSIES